MVHRDFMAWAIELAKQAMQEGEIPIGAVVVKDGVIIGEGGNRKENDNMSTAHAEIIAIQNACKTLNSWRLEGCTIYVTLEPCPMCAGAIINSRIDTVVYSLIDFKAGAFGGLCDLSTMEFNHKPEIIMGVMEQESREILKEFFEKLRDKQSKNVKK